MSNKDVKGLIKYIEDFTPIRRLPEKKRQGVPAIVAPEFTEDDWEHLKSTGDWRFLRKRDEQYLKEAQVAEV